MWGGLLVGVAICLSAEVVSAGIIGEVLPEGNITEAFALAREKRENIRKAEEAEKEQLLNLNGDVDADIPEAKSEDVVEVEQNEAEEVPVWRSKKEMREANRKAEIAKERAEETNRFKKKAIKNTEEREKKYEEIMKRKEEKSSRFQRAAAARAEKEKEDIIKKEQAVSESRFTEKAKKRAEERARKRQEKQERLRRNRRDKK